MTTAPDGELDLADAYFAWQMNPCRKPALDLDALPRLEERLQGVPTMGADCAEVPTSSVRKIVENQLQRTFHCDRKFPGKLRGYFEGWVDGRYMIEIYGEGNPWPAQPEPLKPAFMR